MDKSEGSHPSRWALDTGSTRLPAVAWAAAIQLVLAVVLFHQAWAHPASQWAGGCCDPEQSMWWLRWVPYVITHPQNPFFTYHLNAPYGVNLMWNTAQELPSLILAPVTGLFGVLVAYNVQLTLGFALSGLCAFLLLRRWCRGFAGPLVGSLLYELSPYMLGQALGHGELILAISPPLFLLLLDSLINRPERSAKWIGLGIGLLATAQLLTSEEILGTEVVAGLILAALTALLGPPLIRGRLSRIVEAATVAIPVFLVTAGFPLIQQLAGSQRISGPVQNADVFSTDLLNLIAPTSVQWIAPAVAVHRTAHFARGLTIEVDAYLGIPMIILLGYAVWRYRRERVVRTAAAAAVLLTFLSLGPVLQLNGHDTGIQLPWALVHKLPFFDDILPARLMVYVYLAVAVMVAVFVDRAQSNQRWAIGTAQLAAVAIAVIPLIPTTEFPAGQAPIPRLFKHWSDAGIPDRSDVLIAPFIRDGGLADPMLWQAIAGLRFKMPQGYFYIPSANGSAMYGARPSTLSQVMEEVQERGAVVTLARPDRVSLFRNLRVRHVRAVIIGPMTNRALMVRTFTLLFGRAPQQLDGVQIWRTASLDTPPSRKELPLPHEFG